jgi:hypothetical protein
VSDFEGHVRAAKVFDKMSQRIFICLYCQSINESCESFMCTVHD